MNEEMISSPRDSVSMSSREMKSPTAFRTISEVAEGLAVPQHVLRFWESKFQQIRPLKRGGGRRYYRPEDVKIIHNIKDLLYNQGFTIRGVQKLLKEKGSSALSSSTAHVSPLPTSVALDVRSQQKPNDGGLSNDKRRELEGLLAELKSIRNVLQKNGF